MALKTTFFGLEIIDNKFVREADILRLPFAGFWQESAILSAVLSNDVTGERLVYLHDWERFSRLFIQTGQHRFTLTDEQEMPTKTHQLN